MRSAVRLILAVLFLTAFVAVVAVTVRSTIVEDWIQVSRPPTPADTGTWGASLVFSAGNVEFIYGRTRTTDGQTLQMPTTPRTVWFTHDKNPPGSWRPRPNASFSFLGLQIAIRSTTRVTEAGGLKSSSFRVVVPFWLSMLAAGLPAGYVLFQLRRNWPWRRGPTACKSCGYDLRAGHEKCPECGAVSHVAAAAKVEPKA